MPNTIAHIAVAGILTRSLIKSADLKWIFLGCVLADIPWILQRLVHVIQWQPNPYDVRAYAITQSSLLLCIILSLALALVARDSLKVFFILALGSLIHLLLDATQIKWANGVLLLAPFDWHLFKLGYFWPESLITYALTAAGAGYYVYSINVATQPTRDEFNTELLRWITACLLIFVWLILPLVWLKQPYQHDHHFISTLENSAGRAGKLVEFDRNYVVVQDGIPTLRTAFGELLVLNEPVGDHGNLVSIRGKFSDNHSIDVQHSHGHTRFRDRASMVGLLLVLLTWFVFFVRQFRSSKRNG